MARVKIKVIGPYPAWDEQARHGRLERSDGTSQAVLLHPGHAATAPDLDAARAEGRAIGGLQHPRILHLKQVTEASGAAVVVYDGFEGASLARVRHVLSQPVPPRVAFELASAVADALDSAWARSAADQRVVHPGVSPGHLLLGLDGQLRIVGFRAPGDLRGIEGPPGYLAPEGMVGPASLVYGIGALLLDLLGGELPQSRPAGSQAPDPARHATVLRRSLIGVLSRPGPRLPESAVDLVRSCLAWRAEERPALSGLAGRLGVTAAGLPAPGLERWTRSELARLWNRLQGQTAAPPVRTLPMAVGPLPEGVKLARPAHTMVPEEMLDEPTEGASRLPTEQVRRRPELSPDAPTAEDTEEVDRTEALPEGEGAEVTVSTPRPEESVPFPDDTQMSHFAPPADGHGPPVPVPILTGQVHAPRSAAAGAVDIGGAGEPAEERSEVDDWRPKRSPLPLVAAAAALVLAVGGWWLLRDRGEPPEALVAEPVVEAPVPPPAEAPVEAPSDDGGGEALAQADAVEAGADLDAAAVPEAPATPAAAAAPVGSAQAAPSRAEAAATAPPPGRETERPASTARTTAPAGSASEPAADQADEVDAAAAYIAPPRPAGEGVPQPNPVAVEPTPAAAAPVPAPTGTAGSAAAPTPPIEGAQTEASVSAPVEAAPAPPAPVAESPPYTLRFRAGSGVKGLEITCHGGLTGSGTDVRIPQAVPGPCRVVGTLADGSKRVEVVAVSRSRDWTCFEEGERACR